MDESRGVLTRLEADQITIINRALGSDPFVPITGTPGPHGFYLIARSEPARIEGRIEVIGKPTDPDAVRGLVDGMELEPAVEAAIQRLLE